MDLFEAVRQRRSIRGFKPDPVPRDVIMEILDVTCRAPSAMNIQPWEFLVLSGDTLDKVRDANVENLRNGVMPQPEHPPIGWPRDSVYRQRQVELAKGLFSLLGISRDDQKRRTQWTERGFRFFEAPAAVILLMDTQLYEPGPLMDIGCAIQTLCLAAVAKGLGTCIEDQGVMYPDILRRYANVPEDRRITMGIAIGYPDPDYPANKLVTDRQPASEKTTFVGLD
ncbi:MAG: nitroreductase [Desulfatibacillaceae bacterium]